ncbi:MAG: hypothetical protein V1887_01940 [Candidatus Aenigmatarchaeota archaeon]
MQKRSKSRAFDSPFLTGLAAILAVFVINAAAFNVPLIPVVTANGQTVELGIGAAGIPLLGMLLMIFLFVKRRKMR